MGNTSSKADDGASLYLRDPNRFTITSLVISSPKKRSSINITPNTFPPTRITASRVPADDVPIDFIQDPDATSAGPPNFILKLPNDEDLTFTFTFVIRQAQFNSTVPAVSASLEATTASPDTHINGLTYVYASTPREVDHLVTREFHADPNLHKNPQVSLVGDYSTSGSSSVTFDWTWKWKPPKSTEDKGNGWRTACSFVEYDSRAHKLHTLASFSYWVSNVPSSLGMPYSPPSNFSLHAPPKIRVGSSQSIDSRFTPSADQDEPPSPMSTTYETTPGIPQLTPLLPKDPVKIDVSCPKPGEDVTDSDDGPLFRATMKALEQKTGNMRTQMKRVLKKAEQAYAAQIEANDAFGAFVDSLREASSTNANAVQPAIEHYFDRIARDILSYERQNTVNLQKIIIDPLNKLYTTDIKQADSKKRDFEEDSKEYYSYLSRYLGQRHDSVKAKKLAESDSKYQTKRRNFELKRFDYSSFMQDLHGGRKEQEVLSYLTRFASAQTQSFLDTAKRIDDNLPQLEALSAEVRDADKEYQYQRWEREEKRRYLEKSNANSSSEVEPLHATTAAQPIAMNGNHSASSDAELGRTDSTSSQLRSTGSLNRHTTATSGNDLSRSPGSHSYAQPPSGSPVQAPKFKGIRDLEERDYVQLSQGDKNGAQRKEGLLWALSRPGLHVDPRNLNKQGWHKFWIVLDQGTLSEYSNWKQRLDLHMDPIDLRMASVREARNAERRFCFEVITPNYKRVYQATSEEDMINWITAINNALQGAMEGRGLKEKPDAVGPSPVESLSSSFKRDIGSILTGKSLSLGHSSHNPLSSHSSSGIIPARRTTVGARPMTARNSSNFDDDPDKLLQLVRENDQGNCWCADCGSGSKVEWVSINLGIILCIECSGIHRSLGTHISKVRSLTLDITSFTPDIIEVLLLIGNRVSNMIWESKLDPAFKPSPQTTREQRLKFISAKYVDRIYVEPISSTLSRYSTADETLLAAVKKNEIQQVLYALALRANPNTTDKSRGTHAVFLALAAADPAAPGSVTTSGETDGKTIPFAIAELLLQNGAELPASMPAFPLSRGALLYIEMKRGRSAAASMPAPSLSTNSAPPDRFQRDRESRLQKRVSAGGKLAKSPIPER